MEGLCQQAHDDPQPEPRGTENQHVGEAIVEPDCRAGPETQEPARIERRPP